MVLLNLLLFLINVYASIYRNSSAVNFALGQAVGYSLCFLLNSLGLI